MKAITRQSLSNIARTVAIWTSGAAPAVLAGGFVNESYNISDFTGSIDSFYLPAMLGLIATVFASYLLAISQPLAKYAGAVAGLAVTGIFLLSRYTSGFWLHPALFALAAPGAFHMASAALARSTTSTTETVEENYEPVVASGASPEEVREVVNQPVGVSAA